MLVTRSAIWLMAEGRNHLDAATACMREGDFVSAGEACDRAESCRCDAESKLGAETDLDIGQTLNTLRLDIRIARARIRAGANGGLLVRTASVR